MWATFRRLLNWLTQPLLHAPAPAAEWSDEDVERAILTVPCHFAVDQTTHGFGTRVRTGTWTASTPETPPADGSFVVLGELVSLSLPPIKVTRVDAKHLTQADRWMRKKAGFVDPGEPTYKIHFRKADYNTLLGYVNAGTELWWSLDIPEPDDPTHFNNLKFHGFVGDLGGEVPEDDGITCDVTLVCNGKPQFTAYP